MTDRCPRRRWRRFDIGFDQGWCRAACRAERREPRCGCGLAAGRAAGETEFEFYCPAGACRFRLVVPRGDV